jgi:hypothetical protein
LACGRIHTGDRDPLDESFLIFFFQKLRIRIGIIGDALRDRYKHRVRPVSSNDLQLEQGETSLQQRLTFRTIVS